MLAFVSGVQYFHCAFEVTDARGKVHHLEMPDLVALMVQLMVQLMARS
jgi:hypothetical protein